MFVFVVAVLAACGGEGAADTTIPDSTPTTAAATVPTTSTTAVPSTTSSTVDPSLPGEPLDFGPAGGDVLGVVGVAHDEVLNVRAAPGTDQVIVATLGPLADDVTARGNTRSLPNSIWFEVELDEGTGWSSAAFLAYLGQTTDQTAAIIELLGETPGAGTMQELGSIVADALASEDPQSNIEMSGAPTVGDLGEVTYDVVGLGDDALKGFRLHVFGTPMESGEGFELKTVEQTLLCSRGVSGDGLCN